MGLCYSIVFYSFLYLMREVLRILSVTDTYDLWILTDKEVHFYNLIFAYISIIIGQSVTFSFWLDRPKSLFEKRNYRKLYIISDQRAFNWYFISWFSQLAFMVAIVFGFTFHGGFYVVNLFPDFRYIFILIILVLFFQSWNRSNQTFKRKGQKWMLISGAVISILAFGMSRVHLIDYNSINQNIVKKSIYNVYNLDLAEASHYEKLYNRSLIENIYIVESKQQGIKEELLIVNSNEHVKIDELHSKIAEWQSKRSDYDGSRIVYRLNIHQSIKMNYINQVKAELVKSGVSSIAYAVIPTNRKYDKKYYQNFSFLVDLPNWDIERTAFEELYNSSSENQNIIEIKQYGSDYLINNLSIKTDQIKNSIKTLIHQNSDYLIKFYVNDDVLFSDYFRVLSSVKMAVNELKNDYSNDKYAKPLDSLEEKEAKEIEQKFPFKILEINSQLLQSIEKH